MKLPAYSRYKPSGVEWLGDVPEHWRTLHLKWVGESITGLTYSPADVVSENEGTLVLRSSNIQRGRIVLDDNVFISSEIPQILFTRENDILICSRNGSRALVGKSGKISRREAGLSFGAFTTVFRSEFNNYAFYVFQSDLISCQAGLYQTSTINQLTIGTLNSFQIPFPPPPEQQAIVEFLDRETGRMDRLIEKKRELIERLKEKRSALISRTVTRGLPPEAARDAGLPENPTLKPSGLDWLGDIPAHWTTRRLRHISDTITVGVVVNPSSYVTDEGVPFLLGGDIREFKIDVTNSNRCSQESSDGPLRKSRLDQNDLVVVRVGYPGVAAVVPAELAGANCASMMLVRKNPRFCSSWLAYVFNSQVGRDQIEIVQYGAAQKQFNISHAVDFEFPFPPLTEQVAIAEYLDANMAKVDALVAKVEEAIERLQEYRTAIITAAVTGKIDVRKTNA